MSDRENRNRRPEEDKSLTVAAVAAAASVDWVRLNRLSQGLMSVF